MGARSVSDVVHFLAEDIIRNRQWLRGKDWYLLLGVLAVEDDRIKTRDSACRGCRERGDCCICGLADWRTHAPFGVSDLCSCCDAKRPLQAISHWGPGTLDVCLDCYRKGPSAVRRAQ